MASKIVPPFKVDEYFDGESQIDLCIRDANQEPIVLIDTYINQEEAFAKALCAVMNKRADELVDAANGKGEPSNENTNTKEEN